MPRVQPLHETLGPLPGTGTYPICGLPPLLLGWHKGLATDRPAPEDFVVVHRDVWFLRDIPRDGHGHASVTVDGGVRQPEVGWGRGCGRI